VWGRRPHARAPLAHLGLYDNARVACRRIQRIATFAARHGGHLVAALAPQIVNVPLKNPSPAGAYAGGQLELTFDGGVNVTFRVPRSGVWDLWLRGEIMPAIAVDIDGRPVATLADQLAGNNFNPDTIGPLRVHLRAGSHQLGFTPAGSILAPGASGDANLGRAFQTPAAAGPQEVLRTFPASAGRSLCGRRYDWIEAVG
jgi:hypothetical protein